MKRNHPNPQIIFYSFIPLLCFFNSIFLTKILNIYPVMLESATKFILDLVLENETVRQFPKEFVDASAKWMRSWFLTDDDPATTAVLKSPDASAEVKQAAVQKKTEALMENPDFRRELEGYLKMTAGTRVENSENVLIGNTIHAQNVYVGHVSQAPAAGAAAPTNWTATERQDMEQRLNLLLQKRAKIQRSLDLETDAAQQFKYEQQIAEEDKKIAELKNQLGI